MGHGKSPWYTHRLMHRKGVTSELHDSYFRLMTIKHAIPKIEWAIEWAIKLLYNSVKTGSQGVGGQTSWRSDELETRCGRESHTRPKGPSGPAMEFGDLLVTRCGWESLHPVERASGAAQPEAQRPTLLGAGCSTGGPKPPVEQLRRTRKTVLMAIRVGVNILQFCLLSNSLSQ